METTSGKETITVLRRLIAYAEKIFQLSKDIVTQVSDRREKPRISTAAVVKSSLVLFWGRLGSINAWEQVGRVHFWKRWLEEPTFSADTLGRVHAVLHAHGLRQEFHDVYERLKRNKALPVLFGPGGIFQTYSPGPKCGPRCAWCVPWRLIRFTGNSTSGTILNKVTGSG